jgi:hypothetical protein
VVVSYFQQDADFAGMASHVQLSRRLENMMTLDFPMAERRLKNTARVMQQSMWLLLVIALSLMTIIRHSSNARAGSLWILGCAILAFMLTFALRDVVRKVGHRNTEDKIVNDVKTFLRSEPVVLVARPRAVAPAVSRPVEMEDEKITPRVAMNFMPLKGAGAYRVPADDLIVFDAIQSRPSVAVRMEFFPVLLPVVIN